MTKETDDAYRHELRRVRGLSDEELRARRAELQATIEEATRDFMKTLERSVACGAMTSEQASAEFERFEKDLDQIKAPSDPS